MARRHRTSNIEWWRADQERRRSSVATPHRNRKRYRRADHRKERQRGYED